MQRKLAGALLVVLAVGLVACGGGSKPLSPSDFRAQVNAVCSDVARQVQQAERTATSATRVASLTKARTAMEGGLKRLDGIDPPTAMAARFTQFKTVLAARVDAARELAKAHPRLSAASQRAVRAHDNPGSDLARSMGFSTCG